MGPVQYKFRLERHEKPCQSVLMDEIIYKIATRNQWNGAKEAGVFRGAPVDHADGYIHFSTARQVRKTAALHFSGQADLLLIAVSAPALGKSLAWEPSRGGELFPHLYGHLPLEAVTAVYELPLRPDSSHGFPPEIPS
jgi:uncharacterized protein (DUF952 family)